MKPIFFGMNVLQLITAVIVGLLIGMSNAASDIPSPVEKPVQITTPVPTPPPVVITQPVTLSVDATSHIWVNQSLYDYMLPTADTAESGALFPVLFIWNNIWWISIVLLIYGTFQIFRLFRINGGEY